MPRIHTLSGPVVTSGAGAANAARPLRVDVRESRACVNAGNGPRIYELIPQIAAHADEQNEKTCDDSESDHALPD